MGIVKKKKRNFVNFAPIELKIGANESARKKKKKSFFFEIVFSWHFRPFSAFSPFQCRNGQMCCVGVLEGS